MAAGNIGPPFAADIDSHLEASYELSEGKLRLSGTVNGDNFSNGEVIATDPSGQSVHLKTLQTTGGRGTGPYTRLPGEHEDVHLVEFDATIDVDKDGNFLNTPLNGTQTSP